jgi:hypothetical protein
MSVGKKEVFMLEQATVKQDQSFQTYNMYGDKTGVIRGSLIRLEGPIKVINRQLKLRLAEIDTGIQIESHYIPV